jgi:hypothetical protein
MCQNYVIGLLGDCYSDDAKLNSNKMAQHARETSSMSHSSSMSSIRTSAEPEPDESETVNELGFNLTDQRALEREIFTAINEGEREFLLKIFDLHPSPTSILQLLLTTTYPNRDGFYQHDPEVLTDANELLGPGFLHLTKS